MDDYERLIQQIEKITRYEKALKEIADFDDRDVNRYNSTHEFYEIKSIARKALRGEG